MLDSAQHILYVGKARNLKKRLSNYFRKSLDSKTHALMGQVADIQITITSSNNEALLLESNLIKKYRPKYNVLLRDDKSYPYLYLSTQQEFPRLDFYRGNKSQPGRYFGPYPSAGAVRDNLALIQKLFKIRQCSDAFFRARARPCLQYQIKRCTAPCVGFVNQDDYQEQVRHAILFLEGKETEVVEVLQQKMEEAAEKLEFEEASQYRDQIVSIRKIQAKQYISGEAGDMDLLGAAQKLGHIAFSILFVRGGLVIGQRAFFPQTPSDTDIPTALSEFIPQYYLSPLRGNTIVERIILSASLPDREWIQDALQEKFGTKVLITDRKTERYRRLLEMAKTNAEYALAQHLTEKKSFALKFEALQAVLEMPNPIMRMECFDISHTMGEATVASCVVFGVEGPLKNEYRRFNITDITPGDDYAAMHQVLLRRYTRLKEANKELPDLIVIDGGKGQLNHAAAVLEELQVSGVTLLGIAKGPGRKAGLEHLYLLGKEHPIQLEPDDIAFHLLQHIRDEAHRFAITAHRAKRGKKRITSPLEEIEGIGPKKRRALLQHFGGLQELMNASIADLVTVEGINEELAKRIYEALH